MATNILLIDLSSIAHREFHTSANDPDPNATATKTVAKVRALASGRLSGVAIAMDGPPYFRKDIDPAYKAQRDKENNAVVGHQIATAADTLRADGFPVWQVRGFEADDIVASASKQATDGRSLWALDGCTVTIASADKDLEQLVSERVTIHKPDGGLCDASTVLAKRGVDPRQMVDYLALVGDASDNIKGCNGIGEKKAAALLAKYGTLEDVFADLDTHGTNFTPATATALREFQGRMETVRSLIRLRTDVLVPFEEVFKERVASFGAEEDTMAVPEVDHAVNEAAEGAVIPSAPEPRVPADPMRELAKAAEVVNSGAPPRSEAMQARQPEPSGLMPVPLPFERELEPRSYGQVKAFSVDVHASRLFSAYGNAAAVMTTVMAGREMNMSAMASLRAFHIIDGKPTLAADLIRALVIKSPACEYFRCTERTAYKATFVTKRRGDPEISLTFTLAEGRAAWPKDDAAFDKSGWGRNPADMCVARASAKLARLVYPDVVHGLFAPEEMD